MALSKLEIDTERAEEIAHRMKEIIETTWLERPILNDELVKEFGVLNEEIKNMGIYVSYEYKLNLDNPSSPKMRVELIVWIPQNATV